MKKDFNALVMEICENLPEYAVSFDCLSWDYKKCAFKLEDIEDGEIHNLDKDAFVAGLKLMYKDIEAGKLPGLDLTKADFFDPCCWDDLATDCALQYSIFQELVYG